MSSNPPAAHTAEGLDKPPYYVNLVLAVHRAFQNAMPYSPRTLQAMVKLLPEGAIFGVSGIGPAQLLCIANALLLGGHIRVGPEDNLYYSQGRLATNLEPHSARCASATTWATSWRRAGSTRNPRPGAAAVDERRSR